MGHNYLDLTRGSEISFKGVNYNVICRPDAASVLARTSDGKFTQIIPVADLTTEISSTRDNATTGSIPPELVDDIIWEQAVEKRKAVVRVFQNGEPLQKVADDLGCHPSTLYELRQKLETRGFEGLIVSPPSGGAGKSRLSEEQEAILVDVIRDEYLIKQKKTPAAVYEELKSRCKKAGVDCPGRNTVYRRCHAIDEQEKTKKRHGDKAAKDKFAQTMGGYQEATRPLEIVQIDHTLMDIIIVDDETRQPIDRPWLTIAIDVYSRMVYGFYISLDHPSAMSTALCLQQAICNKDKWLAERGVNHAWGISGFLETLHMDNGKDFRSKTLLRGCDKHDVDMIYRPVGKPEFGAHVERLIGTFMQYMKVLPGATFSNIDEKGEYDSEKHAAMTIGELEKWFATLVTGRYHKEKHSTLGMSPEKKFLEGLQGSANTPGAGINRVVVDEDEILMDFTPLFEKTVQNYGVQIDKVRYNCPELKRFLHQRDPATGKKRIFIVRRDPRDISVVHFFDPDARRYITIPYRNKSRPMISLFELHAAQKRLKDLGQLDQATEEELFRTHEELKEIQEKAKKQTKKARKDRQRRKLHRLATGHKKPTNKPVTEVTEYHDDETEVVPFDEIEMS